MGSIPTCAVFFFFIDGKRASMWDKCEFAKRDDRRRGAAAAVVSNLSREVNVHIDRQLSRGRVDTGLSRKSEGVKGVIYNEHFTSGIYIRNNTCLEKK